MGTKLIAAISLALILCGCASEMTKGTVLENKEAPETLGSGLEAIKNSASGSANPENACIELCKAQAAKGSDLSGGPCLANPMGEFPDWVCDVAHSPRTETDNNPENQCSAFREGNAKHFVEVDGACAVIKVY